MRAKKAMKAIRAMKAMKAMKVISKTFLERFKNLGFITKANAATES